MRRNKRERGQSLVELAISITVLVFLLSGAIEFGMMFFQYIQLRDAAQEGALFGSINPADTSGIEARARGASTSPVDLYVTTGPQKVDVKILVTDKDTGNPIADPADACPGDAIQVTVSYDHKVFMPFITQIVGDFRTLNGSVTDTILVSPATCP
jgi:Flp pilus assembly protein TadG